MFRYILTILIVILVSAAPVMAKDWYVRPAGGDYGQENGTSYEDAWDGLLSVVFGAGGVSPGDTLWVCGTHLHEMKTKDRIAGQATRAIPAGTGEDSRVTIRGDYEGDPGTIFNAYLPSFTPWVKESGNTYSMVMAANHYADLYYEKINENDFRVMDKAASLEEVNSKPGSFWSSDYKLGSKIYVQLSDSSDPTGKVLFNRFGYRFWIGNNSYITIKGITFFSFYRMWEKHHSAHHLRFEGNKFFFGEYLMLPLYNGMDYVEILNNEIAWAGVAIYTISYTATGAPSYYTIKGNYIHDIGVRNLQQNRDAHCVGIQGGVGGVIDSNICINCGTGPLLYAYSEQELKDTVVSRNFVKDCHMLGSATGFGISTMCTNTSTSDKTGNKFYYNVVVNSPVGYRFQFEKEQEVYNNVAYNCGVGIMASRTYEDWGPAIKARNNIVMNSTKHHVYFGTGGVNAYANFDNNIFYPDGPTMFALAHKHSDLAGWKKWQISNYVFDPNSVIADPEFADAANGKFQIKTTSPAVGKGVPVGLMKDKANLDVTDPPDIGAYQHVAEVKEEEPAPAPEVVQEETTTTTETETIVLTAAEIKDRDRWVSKMIYFKRLEYFNMTAEEWAALSSTELKKKKSEYGKVFHAEELVYHGLTHTQWQKLTYEQERELRWKQAKEYFDLNENWEQTS